MKTGSVFWGIWLIAQMCNFVCAASWKPMLHRWEAHSAWAFPGSARGSAEWGLHSPRCLGGVKVRGRTGPGPTPHQAFFWAVHLHNVESNILTGRFLGDGHQQVFPRQGETSEEWSNQCVVCEWFMGPSEYLRGLHTAWLLVVKWRMSWLLGNDFQTCEWI